MNFDSHININDLNVYYGNLHVIKNLSLDIPDKSITAIIGPSGCGKSTLLKTINRLIDLDDNVKIDGDVIVDGENVYNANADISNIRRKMGLLLQKPYPLPMSIYNNVAYGPKINGTRKKKSLNEIVVKYLKMVNLWSEVKDRVHSSASRLSLGQQQRLCLARGLAVEPEIILADEPTASLDPISSKFIEDKLFELKNNYTVILVTHMLHQAKKLADYVAFMYLGELIEIGTANDFFDNPKNELTRRYLSGIFG